MVIRCDENVEDLVRLHVQLAFSLDIAHKTFLLRDLNRSGLIRPVCRVRLVIRDGPSQLCPTHASLPNSSCMLLADLTNHGTPVEGYNFQTLPHVRTMR